MKVDIYNTGKKYGIIYADPPWRYADKNCKGACERHYETLTAESMKALPVERIAEKDSALFLWATYPQLGAAMDLIRGWGFTYKTIAFQWIKLNKGKDLKGEESGKLGEILKKACFFGLGRWTRGNTECCLLATKGKPCRKSAGVSQLVFEPIGRHSEKPAAVREKIIELTGEAERIELFARQSAEGWDCWGNEV